MIDPDTIARVMAGPLGGAILLNQLDELFIDVNYLARRLHRRSATAVSAALLRRVEPKRTAILLPAWREEDVIERMLELNVSRIDFPRDRYVFFCGTYQNDPATQARVDRAAARGWPVRKVVVPHAGPTSKADCLNWIYQGVVLHERERGTRFDILLMHDAEDVIHPLALRLYSLLVPKHEFVQTPVFSLPLDASQVVAGTYIDEFAEHHLKELPVRQAIGGLIPSAGVGSAFERRAFEQIALAHAQQPFDPASLTEDYEIGLRFRLARRRTHFACYRIAADPDDPEAPAHDDPIATREYFPDRFQASVRQRSRWILGISLQTWESAGWQGPAAVRYCLWRDRKAVLTNALLALSYALLAYVVVRVWTAGMTGASWSPARIVPAGGLIQALLLVNLAGFLLRVGVKMGFVGRLYGARLATLCLPRLLVANVISLAATARAVVTYVRHLVTGEPLRWVKTSHAFPSAEALAAGDAQAAGADDRGRPARSDGQRVIPLVREARRS
ncbi:bacteriophage N4 adsorption protein B [Anaeromyxobacter dehalogenans 2CP-1]|uniref:Bacteriophage N4 adsorption protein B n=1 Tax=Anaeromyxobacter dehalogenans (strain ATCC BAA-258 / DSM 21875 / 2CP-1) TaxID=455488 RepID=B8JA61_ANAD2|nr:glycosyl transferase family protein [Anaeromyxobacter dehalogenans]ACL65580.1 bacteriophage N4 adsorption protein B [Anaeromyxobacter dehalogenans 2CP-1]